MTAALCAMVGAGHRDPDVIVAIYRDGRGTFELFPPCGRCRELISDFDPNTWMIVGSLELPPSAVNDCAQWQDRPLRRP